MPQPGRSAQHIRAEIAQLAARLIAVDGVSDYRTAKRKAALQLGLKPDRCLPTNEEIEQALSDYQRLFQGNEQPGVVQSLREQALAAMQLLAAFSPRLVGPVLAGTASRHSEIVLHLHCDTAEEVSMFLQDRGIPLLHTSRSIKARANTSVDLPAFRFLAGDCVIVLVAFGGRHRGMHPLSPIDGKPMPRARIDEVEALLNTPA